jgi:hypothetical protein
MKDSWTKFKQIFNEDYYIEQEVQDPHSQTKPVEQSVTVLQASCPSPLAIPAKIIISRLYFILKSSLCSWSTKI